MHKISHFLLYFLSAILIPISVLPLPPVIRIGGIFPEELRGTPIEVAFKYGVFAVNRDRKLLGNSTLVYRSLYFKNGNLFQATKAGCQLMSGGVFGLFGSGLDTFLESHLRSLSSFLDFPLLLPTASASPKDDSAPLLQAFPNKLAPSRAQLGQALRDAVLFFNWTRLGLIYEEEDGLFYAESLLRKNRLVEVKKGLGSGRGEIFPRQVSPISYRDALREIKRRHIFNLVVEVKHLTLFFRIILQLQMNDARYHFHFVTLDLELYDLEDFAYNGINITSFRLIQHTPADQRVMDDIQRFNSKSQSRGLQTDAALMYDSVLGFCEGLKAFDLSHEIRPPNISCEREDSWPDGHSLVNYINSVSFRGLTGEVRLREGLRTEPGLTLIKLKDGSLEPVGHWTNATQLIVHDYLAFSGGETHNITLRVTTVLEKPYVMMKDDEQELNLTGNARYEGFCIDLLKDIGALLGFDYMIETVEDGKYGVEDPHTHEWNGVVRDLIQGKSDLAVGSMTINSAREKVIDFTKPFRNLGISILFKLPKKPPARLFSFLNPLSAEIWSYVGGAYLIVCCTLFVVARFTPGEWLSPPPCSGDEGVLENQFSFPNSVWFITGTFLRQGSGLNPKTTSTRLVGGIWWFFTLIIVSSYTANLAAFLTVDRKSTPIESAQDLADQSEISYGTLDSGSTMDFFRNSSTETHQKMWRYMEKKPDVFVQTYEQGIDRVLQGNYAFLIESPMLDFVMRRDCNLTQVGGLLDSKGYGIAMPKGSPWRDKLSLAILELQEKGTIQLLYDKWWKNTGDVCNEKKDSKAASPLADNIGGVFVVLFAGLVLAVIAAIFEFCCHAKKNASLKHNGICSECKVDFRIGFCCCLDGGEEAEEREQHTRDHQKLSPSSTYVLVLPHLTSTNNQPTFPPIPSQMTEFST